MMRVEHGRLIVVHPSLVAVDETPTVESVGAWEITTNNTTSNFFFWNACRAFRRAITTVRWYFGWLLNVVGGDYDLISASRWNFRIPSKGS
jgi:hypothetical protein